MPYVWKLEKHVKRLFARGRRDGACLVWTGPLQPNGYAQTEWHGVTTYAHRVAYELAKGPIPEGLVIDHLCRNRACFEAEHLEAVTQKVNNYRGVGFGPVNKAKTACSRGHAFTPENTWIEKDGRRHCRQCARDRKQLQRRSA